MRRFSGIKSDRARVMNGFTLIELLIVISVILILIGLLASGAMVLMQRAHKASTQATIQAVMQAVSLYRDEDEQRRFPPDRPDHTLRHRAEGPYVGTETYVATLLMRQGLAIHGEMLESDAGGAFLADAWGGRICYQVDGVVDKNNISRPLDALGMPVRVPQDVGDWNPRGEQPMAYVWSYGRPGPDYDRRENAQKWIYHQEAP